MGSSMTIHALFIILISAPVKVERQATRCPNTELSTLVLSGDINETCLTNLPFNSSSNFTMVDLNPTDDLPTGNQVSLIDTGFTSMEMYQSLELSVNFIITPITAVLGLVGNILSMVTLIKQKPRDTITIYLISLCVADLLSILCSLVTSISRIITRYNFLLGYKVQEFTFIWIGLFFALATTRASAYITVVLSLERLIAVRLPFWVKQTYLNRHPWKIVLFIYIVMILFFFPNLFRFDLSIGTHHVTNQSYLIIAPSQFAKSSEFYIYLGTAAQVITRILPMVLVLVCNLVIIVSLRASVRFRKHMVSSTVQNYKTTRLLLTISAIFLLCTIPGTVNGIVVKFVEDYGFLKKQQYLYSSITVVSIYLETFNCAINFVVYIVLGSNFRAAFLKLWGSRCCQTKQTEGPSVKPSDRITESSVVRF